MHAVFHVPGPVGAWPGFHRAPGAHHALANLEFRDFLSDSLDPSGALIAGDQRIFQMPRPFEPVVQHASFRADADTHQDLSRFENRKRNFLNLDAPFPSKNHGAIFHPIWNRWKTWL